MLILLHIYIHKYITVLSDVDLTSQLITFVICAKLWVKHIQAISLLILCVMWLRTLSIPILWIRNLKLREISNPAQDDTTDKEEIQESSIDLLNSGIRSLGL